MITKQDVLKVIRGHGGDILVTDIVIRLGRSPYEGVPFQRTPAMERVLTLVAVLEHEGRITRTRVDAVKFTVRVKE